MPVDAIAPGPRPARRVSRALWVLLLLLVVVVGATLWALNQSTLPEPAATEPSPTATPTPAATPPPTPSAAVGITWNAFVENWLTPLAGVGTFIAGAWLALFVVARLFVELPLVRNFSSSSVGRRWTAGIGWGLLILSPIAFVLAANQTDGARDIPLLVAIAVLGLFGAVTLSWWLASLRRMQLTVTAAEDLKGADVLDRVDVITQLRALVGSRHGRIEVPAGPQIETISEALSSLSSSKWVAAAQKIVLFLVGVVPWQVTVEQSTTTDASVTVARHGQLQASQRISLGDDSLSSLEPHDPPGANRLLATFVAATIIVALREKYPADIEPGLYGATRARGIALQSIAAQWNLVTQPPTRAVAMLRRAVEADPYNELARSTLDYAEHRGDTSSDDIAAFIGRLTDRIARRGAVVKDTEDDLLQSSWRITRAAMARNLAALTANVGADGSDEREKAVRTALVVVDRAASDMRAWLKSAPYSDDTRPARARAQISLAALDAISRAFDPVRRDDTRPTVDDIHARITRLDDYEEVTTNPGMAYSLACLHLRWHGGTFADPLIRRLLATAAQSPVYRSFAGLDPELSTIADRKGRKKWLKAIAAQDKDESG